MFKGGSFSDREVFKRSKGSVLKELVAPKELNNVKLCDFMLDVESGQIKFVPCDKVGSPYIISDEIGACEETQINCFFINGGMVIELIVGRLYVKDKDGNVLAIDDNGNTQKVEFKESKIAWFDYHDYFRRNLRVMVGHKFNIPDTNTTLIDEYINNLAFTLFIEGGAGSGKEAYSCRMKVVSYFYDLGLDEFEFTVLESVTNESVYNPIYKSSKVEDTYVEDDEDKVSHIDDEDELIDDDTTSGTGYKKAPKLFSDNLGIEEDIY